MKLIFSLSIFSLFFVANFAFAQTSTSPTVILISATTTQVVSSNATSTATTTKQSIEELKITKTLRFGMVDKEVKKLQEFLSKMPEVYPEGLATGYFGPLTQKAVKRLQENNGIESVGIVGPLTRAKIVEISSSVSSGGGGSIPALPTTSSILTTNNIISSSASTTGTTTPSSSTVATTTTSTSATSTTATITTTTTTTTTTSSGSSNSSSVIPGPSSTAPTTSSQSVDTSTLSIYNIQVSAGLTTATITWATSQPANGAVYFSATSSVSVGSHSDYSTSHSVTLNGLQSSRSYSYFITSQNSSGTTTTSDWQSFTTSAPTLIDSFSMVAGGPGQLTFYWATQSGANSYTVYLTNMNTNVTVLKNYSGGTVSSGESNHGDGVPYSSYIVALDSSGVILGTSSTVNVTTMSLPIPTNFTASATGPTSVLLSWTASGGSTYRYQIRRIATNSNGTSKSFLVLVPEVSYTDTAEPGANYTYYIKSMSEGWYAGQEASASVSVPTQ